MKYSFVLMLVACTYFVVGQKPGGLALIPEPHTIKQLPEKFTLNRNIVLNYNDTEAKATAELLNEWLLANYGFKLALKLSGNDTQAGTITLFHDQSGKPENYTLDVRSDRVRIRGDKHGIFYGLQTLRQLFPLQHTGHILLPGLEITDGPRFGYRALMLDVSRHFFSVAYIKKFIDVMSQFKLNTFHWHLTDDQGWRMEIPKYPALQNVSAWRPPGALEANSPYIKDGRYGGYFTQAEIREVVAYAATRHITIIPEIEMPGHSNAALAAYPHLACVKENYKVLTRGAISSNVYCAGNDSVFTFLQDVIDEVIKLFPGKYIHIGGDETPKDKWKACPKCQARIKGQGLHNEHELQSYFVQRMEKYINSKGRLIIGWDEILEGGLAPNATVMSWRGETGGIEAARLHHDVVMTPYHYVYLDYRQAPQNEPHATGDYLPLSKVYSYDPVPSSLTADQQKYIKGIQANTWAEEIPDEKHADYMVYPRALAVAETGWSPAGKKNYARFLQKLSSRLLMLDQQQVAFRIPEPFGSRDSVTTESQVKLSLKPSVENAKVYYTTDGSTPVAEHYRPTDNISLSLKQDIPVTVKTLTVLPSGRQSIVYTTTWINKKMVAATPVKVSGPGCEFKTIYGEVKDARSLTIEQADTAGRLSSFSIAPFSGKPVFGAIYEAWFLADKDGRYTFHVNADDGVVLYLDNELTVDNDGRHPAMEKSGIALLQKGYHRIRLHYFDAGGGRRLDVRASLDGQAYSLTEKLFTGSMALSQKLHYETPVIAGPFEHIFNPNDTRFKEDTTWYTNDHSFIKGKDGVWHAYGIIGHHPIRPWGGETKFFHITGASLAQKKWEDHDYALTVKEGVERVLWAPHVVRERNKFYMFYNIGNMQKNAPDYASWGQLCMASGDDLNSWERHPLNPFFSDAGHARDSYVMKYRGKYYYYYTRTFNEVDHRSVVAVRTGPDLFHWSGPRIVHVQPYKVEWGGDAESPFVVQRNGLFYLFICRAMSAYNQTDVYWSADPENFPRENLVCSLPVHAAEIIYDKKEGWFISNTGWDKKGLFLAPLQWK